MPGGRPTKLTKALLTRAHNWTLEQSLHRTSLPTIEGLALKLGISRDTLYEWEKDNDEFSYILENLRQVQANKLIQNGLLNKYNPTIAKMILSGKHGYVEKQQTDVTSDGKAVAPVLVRFLGEEPKPEE